MFYWFKSFFRKIWDLNLWFRLRFAHAVTTTWSIIVMRICSVENWQVIGRGTPRPNPWSWPPCQLSSTGTPTNLPQPWVSTLVANWRRSTGFRRWERRSARPPWSTETSSPGWTITPVTMPVTHGAILILIAAARHVHFPAALLNSRLCAPSFGKNVTLLGFVISLADFANFWQWHAGWPLVWKTWKYQGIWNMSGKCQGLC